jgi:hypothetical protein
LDLIRYDLLKFKINFFTMKKATVTLQSLTTITFGKFHQTPKLSKELHEDYEVRTWREKTHYNPKTLEVFIPGIMIANCIREAAKFMSIQVPGKGKATYTKHFDSGIYIKDNIKIAPNKEELTKFHAHHVPSDGQRGGTRRVVRYFPKFDSWSGTVEILIGDDIITADVMESVLNHAGSLIGMGTWRPRNRGDNGRFELVKMKWEK